MAGEVSTVWGVPAMCPHCGLAVGSVQASASVEGIPVCWGCLVGLATIHFVHAAMGHRCIYPKDIGLQYRRPDHVIPVPRMYAYLQEPRAPCTRIYTPGKAKAPERPLSPDSKTEGVFRALWGALAHFPAVGCRLVAAFGAEG